MYLGTRHFQKLLLLRFFSYFLMISGLLTITLIIEPVFTEELVYNYHLLIGKKYSLGPKIVTSQSTSTGDKQSLRPGGLRRLAIGRQLIAVSPTPTPLTLPTGGPTTLGSLLGTGSNIITPASTDFGIVIAKLNANAAVIPEVDPTLESSYSQALQRGVAHAKGTAYPGQPGNIYLFSHSTDAPWNIIRFNAIFYLLNRMENGETISLFYRGRRYDYLIFDKVVAHPLDTQYLTNRYQDSILTLQTCDPPGTLLNRLVVRARLASE